MVPTPTPRPQDLPGVQGTPGVRKGWLRRSDGAMEWTELATRAELNAAVALGDGVFTTTPWGADLTGGSLGANAARGVRWVAPWALRIEEIAAIISTSSGNYDLAIYDTASVNRNRLWSKGSTACPAAGVRSLGSPALALDAGDHVDIALVFDNGTASPVRSAHSTTFGNQLPAGFADSPDGGLPIMFWNLAASFPFAATIAESALGTSGAPVLFFLRTTPL